MSCSPKYTKLVEYLKTHYTYQLKLNSFSVGDHESTENAVKRQVYGDVMEFIENLESEQDIKDRHQNNLIPIEFPHVNAADTVDFKFTPDVTVFGGEGSDSLNLSYMRGGMGEDHLVINGTRYDDPKFYTKSDEKDDK
jgi:hypothetical protein